MSGEINKVGDFKLSGDGVSFDEFKEAVKDNKDLIDIYKAFDKNGDNKLSRDELASLLGAYSQIDNGDNKLKHKERKALEAKIEADIKNDENTENDNVKIKTKKLDSFYTTLCNMIAPKNDIDGETYSFDKLGNIVGGTTKDGKVYTRTNTDNGYNITYKDMQIEEYYNKSGVIIGGKDKVGEYQRTYDAQTGGYSDKYSDKKTIIYNKSGVIIGGKDEVGEYQRMYDDQTGGYSDKYSDKKTINYNKSGVIIGGKDEVGEYQRTYDAQTGGYSDKYSDRIRNYDNNDRWIGGVDTGGEAYETTYADDGSWVAKPTDPNAKWETHYDKYGKETGGKLTNKENLDTEYTVHRDASGENAYKEYTRQDGSVYYYDYSKNPDGTVADTDVTTKGEIKTTAREGESFEATMARLGITDEADIAAFKAANPKAAKRNYFLAGQQDVYIPKSLAEKLNMKNDMTKLMVNAKEQEDAWKTRTQG